MTKIDREHLIVLGCGTGRSGTVSLSKILDRCRNFRCSHELEPLMPWEFSESRYEERKKYLLNAREGVGDVHSAYLPYIERFISDMPRIKIICTRRDAEAVASSFEKHIENGRIPNRHHWYDHEGENGWACDQKWDPTFPKYDIRDRHDAIVMYAREYDKKIDYLYELYPKNILIVKMEDLSRMSVQNSIFKFVGIKLCNRRYTRRKYSIYNKS